MANSASLFSSPLKYDYYLYSHSQPLNTFPLLNSEVSFVTLCSLNPNTNISDKMSRVVSVSLSIGQIIAF